MTLVCFGKLAKISGLKNKITRVQLDLLYKRITQLNKVSQMDLSIFFDAIEELANQIFPGQLGKCDALIDLCIENLKDLKPPSTSAQATGKNYMSTTATRRIASEQAQGIY